MRAFSQSRFHGIIIHLFALAISLSHWRGLGANIIIVNLDPPGTGFNDPTPWAPVGGNPATTIGASRLNAFQFAANVWGSYLRSSVTIRVDANFTALPCTAVSAVLGAAGAQTQHRNFANAAPYPAPAADTWYPQALANAINGADLAPVQSDIRARFNSNIGNPDCLAGLNWYYGLDASPPAGSIDLVTVLLHEFGHGLGFQTFVNLATGAPFMGFPDTFMRFLDLNGAVPALWTDMTDAQRLAAEVADPNLVWVGANVTAQGAAVLAAGLTSGNVRMFGPPMVQPGSSVSHYHTALTPNELMEPVYTGPDRNLCLTLALMQDVGWLTTVPATDLYMRDTPFDVGVEPNPDMGDMWKSQDIYIRNQADGLAAANIGVHQNPIYSATQPNYIYVRVHNRGCQPANGQLKVYWSKGNTALTWPTAWINNQLSMGGCSATLFGDQIPATPIPINNLAPGADTIVQIPWMVPNPNDYACFGFEKGHFCLLARIETSAVPPYGMAVAEGSSVVANTRNNNNIVWKNVTVVNSIPCAQQDVEQVMVQNILSNQFAPMALRFQVTNKLTSATNAQFFQFGTMDVDLGPALFSEWQAGGSLGSGVTNFAGTMLRLLSSDANITNITLGPGEWHVLNFIFATTNQPLMHTPALFDLTVTQITRTNPTAGPAVVVGGQVFTVNFNGIGIVPFGSLWKYWDLGFTPDPDWQSPTYDDSSWAVGFAQLGFGDADDATTINGGPVANRYITTYFRQTFSMDADATSDVLYLNFRLRRDDGAVIYLNGQEVFRNNMPTGAVTFSTLALPSAGEDGNPLIKVTVPVSATALTNGDNVLAAEVHLESPESPDLIFDLELMANLPPERPEVTVTNPALPGGTNFPPFEIDATAIDTDGSITNVEFFANLTRLGERTSPPYSLIASNLAPGTYCISARVTDNLGFTNTSAAVPLVVPSMTTISIYQSNGLVTISWPGGGVLQKADMLNPQPNWADVPNNPASPYSTPVAGIPQFFRVRH